MHVMAKQIFSQEFDNNRHETNHDDVDDSQQNCAVNESEKTRKRHPPSVNELGYFARQFHDGSRNLSKWRSNYNTNLKCFWMRSVVTITEIGKRFFGYFNSRLLVLLLL
jgi:hypothetical protein